MKFLQRKVHVRNSTLKFAHAAVEKESKSVSCIHVKENVLEESSIVPVTLCPVGTGPFTFWTYTLFTPAMQKDQSFYLSIYLKENVY